MEKSIFEDLEKRGVEVTAFIVRNENTGRFQLISYGPKGTVEFITDFVEQIEVYERKEGRMISPMATIGKKK